jgi:predicted nicotinamide N-methyase
VSDTPTDGDGVDGFAYASRRRAETAFVRSRSTVQWAPLVPEIALHLATDPHDIFADAERFTDGQTERWPPYWAFAWPGGQGLARHLLDNPATVRGRRIIDIGSGSGIGAIAAAMAGAIDVLAADTDPLACAAITLNAADNGQRVSTTTRDLLAMAPDVDLVLIGDLVYEPELATRVGAFLDAAARAGVAVLIGDRTTARRPPQAFDLVAEYSAPLMPELHEVMQESARVWQLAGTSRAYRRRR